MATTLARAPDSQLVLYLELRARWRTNPLLYVKQRFGVTPTWQQADILEALLPEGAKVSVRSGHGIGKSSSASWAICWFLETHDFAKIPCTAPSSHQLKDILWGELSKWRREADRLSTTRGHPPKYWLSRLFKLVSSSLYDPQAKEWGAFARTAAKENPEALQGFHAEHLLFVIDESSGVPEEIFEAAEGALSTAGARVLMLGNPTRTSGTFYASHHADRASYTTLHFRSQDSPLVDDGYRPRLVQKWGADSNVVRVRADGEFPTQEADVLIPLELAEACLDRPKAQGIGTRKLGVDPARYGSDRTVLVLRQGHVIEHIQIASKQDTMVTVGRIVQAVTLWQVDEVCVDVIGLGGGIVDRLIELQEAGTLQCEVTPVNVAEVAPEPSQGEPRARLLRDYLWLELARWLRDEAPVFAAADREAMSDLAGELSSVRYKVDSNGRIVVESKDEMRKRLGHSPDCFVIGTLVRTPQGMIPIEQLQPGDAVCTPMGTRTILHRWESQTTQLTRVRFSNNALLVGKGKHQIFTWDDGWVRLDTLSLVNRIESDNVWRRWLWTFLRNLCMPVKPFSFKHQVDIISQAGKMRRRDFFIGASTKNIMGLFLMAMWCIILMGIGKTIAQTIWKLSQKVSIVLRICWSVWQNRRSVRELWQDWIRRRKRPRHGMPPLKAWPGIARTGKPRGKAGNLRRRLVQYAARALPRFFPHEHAFARNRVSQSEDITTTKPLLGCVLRAARALFTINIGVKPIVPVSVQTVHIEHPVTVYNLTLDGDNIYYANGILVANCADALATTLSVPLKSAGSWSPW